MLEFKANIVRNQICLNLLKELKKHIQILFFVTPMNAKKAKVIYYIAQNTNIRRQQTTKNF